MGPLNCSRSDILRKRVVCLCHGPLIVATSETQGTFSSGESKASQTLWGSLLRLGRSGGGVRSTSGSFLGLEWGCCDVCHWGCSAGVTWFSPGGRSSL